MSNISELFLLQQDCYDKLLKAQTNFKKSPKERITQVYVEARLEIAEELWREFKANHIEIIKLSAQIKKGECTYFSNSEDELFEETYVAYKTHLKQMLMKFTTSKSTTHTSTTSVEESAVRQVEVKLPRIELPKFSGKYEEWQTYHDMFRALVHTNVNLTPVQKLQYLKSSLSGEPEALIRNFATTDQNYSEAWEQLIKRYDNKRYNCNNIMKTLFLQKQIQNESASALKHLLDTTSACLKSLNNIGIETSSWDAIIIHLVVSKFDSESHKQWENKLNSLEIELPTWNQLAEFMESRFRTLEMIDTGKRVTKSYNNPIQVKPKTFHTALKDAKTEIKCEFCNENHFIYHCKKFIAKPTLDKQNFIQNKGLCFNCFSPNHIVSNCRLVTSCKRCGKRHHSLLHFEKGENMNAIKTQIEPHIERVKEPTNDQAHPSTSTVQQNVVANFSRGDLQSCNVLLATASIRVESRNGSKIVLRALIDQGSQASFVTESTVQLLGLKRSSVRGVVSGLGDGRTNIKHVVSFRVESRHNPKTSFTVNAYVLSSITSTLPVRELKMSNWSQLAELQLADHEFTSPGKIDVLLGADVYSEILLDGVIKHPQENLIAQSTLLGWIISGKVMTSSKSAEENVTSFHVQVREDEWIKQFWELEDMPNSIQRNFTENERKCEEFYELTTLRNNKGRFIVKLPFKNQNPECQYGQSREIAMRKLISLEKRLVKNPKLYEEYRKVMAEYLTLKHMVVVEENEIENPKVNYLPHHAVVREDKDTTKVRVVFNGSSKGVNNVSLNDDLLVGPKLQQDLRHILMRWRIHPIAIVADLVKMYRQVLVDENDANFQRILWRKAINEPIRDYKLVTLTFGTASAPYLAIKTLQKLADEEKDKFPIASVITKRDYFVDDLMTGCDNLAEAIKIYDEMNGLMSSGGFQIQKWSSNCVSLLQHIGEDKRNSKESVLIKADSVFKVLGIGWNRDSDNFEYKVTLSEIKEPITKRQVMSDVARLYDPMGWISPVVVKAKIIIQKLWKIHIDWDEELPENLASEWSQYRHELECVKDIKIPRWLETYNSSQVELHAFSDASRAAYAAVIYLRVKNKFGNVHVNLVTSKTKVAPIEKELSIPRLELCGAALAAKLLSEVSQVMGVPKEKLYGWTDSTNVLAWLKGGSSRWVTFVSNRVSEILTILEFEQWGHVTTKTNPADCASRGVKPKELLDNLIWWNGPSWLKESDIIIHKPSELDTHEEERIQSLTTVEQSEEQFIWSKFSSLTKMVRIVSYCRRLLNLKKPKSERDHFPNYITTTEIKNCLQQCIKQSQEFEFGEDIKQLKANGTTVKSSAIHNLCPFLDQNGILRVGGRIEHARVNFDKKHPIIMSYKSHLTRLLVLDAHYKTLHGGPQVMLNFLRSSYWILRARYLVKKQYSGCVTCLRHSQRATIQLMGQLPEVRVTPSKPFKSSGVDYAGPINIRFSPGRGAKSYKGYICLFVCMVTRAIHLEAVTDLTAKAFISAFRRFVSRRGHCQDLFSDNGTNFIGADKMLRDMFDRAKSELPNEIASLLTLERTKWHFIPPHAPNFGGIWEAGIRIAKMHLKKVIGDATLTYEELSTLLAQVEACLNSRPISVLSDNPDDPLPLTPGHFLVGEPLLSIVDEDKSGLKVTGLERWHLIQKMLNDFWKRWSKEYLVTLSRRNKWTCKTQEPNVNDVVILREDNVPATKWMLGKIVQKHVGPDNLTRVVTVKCKSGLLKRPMSKICVLPCNS